SPAITSVAAPMTMPEGGDEERVHALHRRHGVLPGDEVLQVELFRGQRLEIDAGAEGATGAGDDDDARGERAQLLDRGVQIAHPLGVAGIEDFWTVQRETGHRAVAIETNAAQREPPGMVPRSVSEGGWTISVVGGRR